MIPETQKQNGRRKGEAPSIPSKKEAALMLITVIGDGQVRALPDLAVVLAIVIGRGVSAAQALHETAGRLTQVVQAVLARGLTQAEVQVIWSNVVPSGPSGYQGPAGSSSRAYPSLNTGPAQWPAGSGQITDFVASYGLQIVLSNPERLAEVIDTSMMAGANISSGGMFRLRDETLSRGLALKAACQAANTKAAHLAAELGRTLGGVVSLVEEPVDLGLSAMGTGLGMAGSGNGELIFNSRVKITYELR